MKETKFYKGANGLEYKERYDADVYGGGCVSVRIQKPDEVVNLNNDLVDLSEPVIKRAEPEAKAAPTTKPVQTEEKPETDEKKDLGFNIEDLTNEELKDLARSHKVKGFAIMSKRNTLINAIRSKIQEEKSN